jgi:hypothetical protein
MFQEESVILQVQVPWVNYINITKNTSMRDRTLMAITTRGLLENESCYTFFDYQIDIKIRRNL